MPVIKRGFLKFVVLAAFCFTAQFVSADSRMTIGEFSIRSANAVDGTVKIEILKNKEPFQTIIQDSEGFRNCNVDFLFTVDYDVEEEYGFGYTCADPYSPAEYKYDQKEQKFTYAGPMEWYGIFEVKETGGFYIGLDSNFDNEGNERYKSILIFEKPSNKIIQKIGAQADKNENIIEGEPNICKGDCLAIGDYNFDGIEDFSLFVTAYRNADSERIYFLYDPNKKRFVISEFEGANLAFDYEKKLITSLYAQRATNGSGAFERYLTYKVIDNKMVQTKEECYLSYYDEANEDEFTLRHDCNDGYYDGFFRLDSVGLKKNFALFVALNANKTKGAARYKGQAEFINLSLNKNTANDFIYDEIYRGKVSGKYAFTITDDVITAASYTNKDGKRFKLQVKRWD
jgi:hypothetical protein